MREPWRETTGRPWAPAPVPRPPELPARHPFLRFQLTVEPAGEPVRFELTGPPGTREMLEAELGLAG